MSQELRLLAVCNYPSDTRPAHQVFVRALLREMRALGADITVFAPEPVWSVVRAGSRFRLPPRREQRDGMSIHRPRYVTYSTIPLPFGSNTRRWSDGSRLRTLSREAAALEGSPNLCMAHFLYPHGLAAAHLGGLLRVPAVVSLGESSFDRYESTYKPEEIGRLLAGFSGIIANSPLIQERCVVRYGLPEGRVRVFPNGVNDRHFYPRDRAEARELCGLPPDGLIVVFVGQFIERKGPSRVLQAIRSRPDIGAVFLGYGAQVPSGPQVLHSGAVSHEDMPMWLSAGDVFVLPTLDEGCSNAILEALSCGLPVVSSDLPFNHHVLNDDVAILVDPRDPSALSHAISTLVDDPGRRSAMSRAALARSASFRLSDRAARILTFLRSFL